jgi:hypothetical protein
VSEVDQIGMKRTYEYPRLRDLAVALLALL